MLVPQSCQLFANLWTIQSMEFSRSEYWRRYLFPRLIPTGDVRWHDLLMDMSLSKLRELVIDREAGVLQSMGSQSQTQLSD